MEYKVKVLMVLIDSILAITLIISSAQGQPPPWYAGYAYFNYPGGSPPPNGVMGRIYTLSKWVPGPPDPENPGTYTQFYAQWLTAILSYSYNYWVQVGYFRGWFKGTEYYETFYYEACDTTRGGKPVQYFISYPTPIVSNWYNYFIRKTSSQTYWTVGSSSQFSKKVTVSPYAAIDYQAMSEMTTSSINIDGTHFDELQVGYPSGDWWFWDRKIKVNISPYTVSVITNYEFTAGGGG